jgi:hypothetical protein
MRRYRSYRTINNFRTAPTCGLYLLISIVGILLGGVSTQYLIEILTTKAIPFWGAAVIGLFTGEIAIPVAVVVYLLKLFSII